MRRTLFALLVGTSALVGAGAAAQAPPAGSTDVAPPSLPDIPPPPSAADAQACRTAGRPSDTGHTSAGSGAGRDRAGGCSRRARRRTGGSPPGAAPPISARRWWPSCVSRRRLPPGRLRPPRLRPPRLRQPPPRRRPRPRLPAASSRQVRSRPRRAVPCPRAAPRRPSRPPKRRRLTGQNATAAADLRPDRPDPAGPRRPPRHLRCSLQEAEALAQANDIRGCRDAAQKLRLAGVAMPAGTSRARGVEARSARDGAAIGRGGAGAPPATVRRLDLPVRSP